MKTTGSTKNPSEKQSDYCLELIGVGKSFGGLRANDNVNLQVKQGERVAIIGPNGAGKTTLFNMIAGEFFPTDGQIILYGEDVTTLPNYKRVYKGLARTYQITSLFVDYSVLENLLLALIATKKTKFSVFRSLKKHKDLLDTADILLDRLGLTEKKDVLIKNLSYGDQRLVELLLALASKPKILCLDEPNAGLSVAESKAMINVIKNLERDMTILLIEHNMDMVFEVVDRIMVLHDGVVIATETKEDIRKNVRVQQVYLGDVVDDEHA